MKITAELIQQGLSADGFQPGDCVPVRICLSGAGPRNRVKVVITDFVSNNGKISRSCSSVLQTEVIDYCGNHSEQWLDFQYETECWGYIQLGQDTEPGEYQGKVVIKYQDERIENCGIILYVRNTYRAISNLEDFNSLARIKWFQSDAFQESDGVPPSPFVPLRCTGNEIAMLGRTVEIGLFGLPRKIGSYFDQQVLLCEERTELLRQGFVFQMSGETFREKACTVDGSKPV